MNLRPIAGPLGSFIVATSTKVVKTRSEYLVCFSIAGGLGNGQSHPMTIELYTEQLVKTTRLSVITASLTNAG